MKGYRFYEELENKNRKGEKSRGNVVAALLQESGRSWRWVYDRVIEINGEKHWTVCAIAGIFDHPNSPVCYGKVSVPFLRACRRISEARAREIHPALFEYLERSES